MGRLSNSRCPLCTAAPSIVWPSASVIVPALCAVTSYRLFASPSVFRVGRGIFGMVAFGCTAAPHDSGI